MTARQNLTDDYILGRPDQPATRRRRVAMLIALATIPSFFNIAFSNTFHSTAFSDNCTDALVFRCSAELLARGISPYDLDAQRAHVSLTRLDGWAPPYYLPFAYPPNALPLFLLYLVGTPRVASLLFVTLGTALALSGAYVLTRRFCRDDADRAVTLIGLGLGGPILFNAFLGQTGAFAAAALFACVACYRRRPWLAGIFLGLLAFKPQYALPLGLVAVLERQWRTAWGSVLTLAAVTCLSGALFGFGLWRDFAEAAGSFNITMMYMANWFAVINQLWPGYQSTLHDAALPVMLLGALLVALYCMVPDRSDDASLRRLAFAAALAPLASPNTHPYDLIMWFLPLCVGLQRWPRVRVWVVMLVFGLALRILLVAEQRWLLPLVGLAVVLLVAWPRPLPADLRTLRPISRRELDGVATAAR